MRNWTKEEDKKLIDYIVLNGLKKRSDLKKAFQNLAVILGRTATSIEKRYYRFHSKQIKILKTEKKESFFSKFKQSLLNLLLLKKKKKENEEKYLDNIYKEVEMMIQNQETLNKNDFDNKN
jgi:putative cell wall-binding protein